MTLRERTELVRTHTRRVLNRRKPAKAAQKAAAAVESGQSGAEQEAVAAAPAAARHAAPDKPAPGARPGPADRRQDRTTVG